MATFEFGELMIDSLSCSCITPCILEIRLSVKYLSCPLFADERTDLFVPKSSAKSDHVLMTPSALNVA